MEREGHELDHVLHCTAIFGSSRLRTTRMSRLDFRDIVVQDLQNWCSLGLHVYRAIDEMSKLEREINRRASISGRRRAVSFVSSIHLQGANVVSQSYPSSVSPCQTLL